jgi:hypothetical protein
MIPPLQVARARNLIRSAQETADRKLQDFPPSSVTFWQSRPAKPTSFISRFNRLRRFSRTTN